MTARLATIDDAALISAIRHEASPESVPLSESRVAWLITVPTNVFAVATTLRAFCEIVRHEADTEVYGLFPLTIPTSYLFPLLVTGLKEAVRRWPLAADQPIWAIFPRARDSQGRGDGGKELCETWKARHFPNARIRRRPDGYWEISMTLRDIAAMVRRL